MKLFYLDFLFFDMLISIHFTLIICFIQLYLIIHRGNLSSKIKFHPFIVIFLLVSHSFISHFLFVKNNQMNKDSNIKKGPFNLKNAVN